MQLRPICHLIPCVVVPLLWILLSSSRGISGTIIPACNVTLPEGVKSGVITSPNYPYSYMNDVKCHYKFPFSYKSSRTIYRLCLTFHRFDIERHEKCSYDYLQIDYGGPRLCGNNTIGPLGLTVEPPSFDLSTWPTVCYLTSSLRVEVIFKADITSRFPGFYATYNISWANTALQSSLCPSQCHNLTCGTYRAIYDERGCPTCKCHSVPTAPCHKDEFVCFTSAQCIPRRQLCDGIKNCPDGSDETYEHAQCSQKQCQCLSQVGCTFDFNTCEYKRSNAKLWKLYSGKTPSKNTGPSFDHTLMAGMTYRYSSFVYFEASYVAVGRMDTLVVPAINIQPRQTKCFQFWYHMWGEYMGTLELQMKNVSQSLTWVTVWYAKGNQIDMWQVAQIDLVGSQTVDQYELRFMGTRGQSYTSDMALDDISILDGQCVRRDFSCTFENGKCGWEMAKAFSVVPQPSFLSWSSGNVAMGTVSKSSVSPELGGASIESGFITHNIKEPKCLKFKYSKTAKTKITVDYLEDNTYQHEIAQIFGVTNGWDLYELDIPKVYSAYKIVLTVWPYGDFFNIGSVRVYIDDIYFREGPCTMAPTTQTSFCGEPHQFLCYNGNCVKQTDKCDGYDDCKDNSDEESLFANCTGVRCPSYNFLCANGHCIYSDLKCNGVDDCGDNTDEDPIYSNCTSGVSIGGILGIIFGVICCLILVCTLSVFICKFTKQRRCERRRQRRERRETRQSPVFSISHTAPDMMPPPYQAVVNEGFIGDSLYEMPPSYDSIVADNNNGSTTLLTVPPYSVVDPRSRTEIAPDENPNGQLTQTVLSPPVAGMSHSDMVLQPLGTDATVPPLHPSAPPDIVTCALNSNQMTESSRSPPVISPTCNSASTSQAPPTLPPPIVTAATETDTPKDSIEGDEIIPK
ncbi:low-density lipoprotein receptor-related protein 3-like [Lineus longissimus]|uniref:low-density lipoprotein receptor-related protein 3-like n=1 Tax=Lineus longissimus TaxID=88925 RepID=UPI002B4E2DF0